MKKILCLYLFRYFTVMYLIELVHNKTDLLNKKQHNYRFANNIHYVITYIR